MQSCQDGNQNSMNRHPAEHAHVRVEGKAETRTVAVVGVDLPYAPVRATWRQSYCSMYCLEPQGRQHRAPEAVP